MRSWRQMSVAVGVRGTDRSWRRSQRRCKPASWRRRRTRALQPAPAHVHNGSMPLAGAKHQGQTCALASECDTGNCVDGVCCDAACNGQCQACDVSVGVCTTLTGMPHGNRPPCATGGFGFDACTSVCDGHDATMCTFPGSSKPCGAQSCSGPPPVLKSATVCDVHRAVPGRHGVKALARLAPRNAAAMSAAVAPFSRRAPTTSSSVAPRGGAAS